MAILLSSLKRIGIHMTAMEIRIRIYFSRKEVRGEINFLFQVTMVKSYFSIKIPSQSCFLWGGQISNESNIRCQSRDPIISLDESMSLNSSILLINNGKAMLVMAFQAHYKEQYCILLPISILTDTHLFPFSSSVFSHRLFS